MGCMVGDGEINWREFLRLYHKHAEGKPFILEYVTAGNFLMARDRVMSADGENIDSE